jgi:hypothetical protein
MTSRIYDQDPPTLEKGLYRHNKTGNVYDVLGVALHTETRDFLVVYRAQSHSHYALFVRPYAMFTELVVINGQKVPRFERIETPRSFIV